MKLIFSHRNLHLDSISLRTKIIIIFFAFIIVPLTIFMSITYNRINELILTQTLSSASQSFEESASVLNKYFENIHAAMQNIVFDEDIYLFASKDTTNYTPIQQLKDYKDLIKRFDYIQKGAYIDNIRFYIDIDSYYSENNINIFSISKIIGLDWYKNLRQNKKSRLWSVPHMLPDAATSDNDFLTYTSIIYSLDLLNMPLAVLRADIHMDKVEIALTNAAITENSIVFLSDGDKVLFSPSSNRMDSLLNSLIDPAIHLRQWEQIESNHLNYIVRSMQLIHTDWYAIAVIPESDILVLQNNLRNQMILILFLIASISYTLAYVTSHSSLKRLYQLNNEMKRVESGNLNACVKQVGKDEIGELMGSFNKMVARMTAMVDEKYTLGQEMKSAELRALQAQINPHFLYNSLDLVNCLAIQHSIPEITQMVTSLAKFYKLSLSQGNDVISINDELMHVQLYVQIQNLRFENRITLIQNVGSWISEYATPKTILQPLVENSIIHGIFEKEDRLGTIKITAANYDDLIVLTVEDDGIGMSQKMADEILLQDKSTHRHGYGVKNTNDRIQLYYGQDYGLSYQSEIGKGTIVTIKIPAVRIIV